MPKEYRKPMWFVLALGLLSGLLDFRYAAGFALGAAAAVLLYIRNDRYWNSILDGGSATKYTGIFHFFVNYAIMAGVLLLSAWFPAYLNIFGAAIGLFLLKISVILNEIVYRQ